MRIKHWTLLSFLFICSSRVVFSQINIVSQQEIGGWAAAADVKGNYAYFAQGNDLTVVDVSGNEMEKVVTLILPAEPSKVLVSGNYLFLFYTGNDSSIHVFSLANPALPAEVARVAFQSGWPFDGTIDGNRLFCTASGKMAVFNLDNPEAPELLTEFVVDAQHIAHSGDYCYISNGSTFSILDVSNLNQIQVKGTLQLAAINHILVEDNKAYLATVNESNGLNVVDVSDPNNPQLLSRTQMMHKEGSSTFILNPQRIAKNGNFVYVGCNAFQASSLFVVNVEDASAPVVSSYARMDKGNWPSCNSVTYHAPYVYLSTGGSSYGLIRFDVSDPDNATLAGSYDDPSSVLYLCGEGDKLYTASQDRLWVYQVTGQDTYQVLGSGEAWPGLERIDVHSGIIFGVLDNVLYVLDASDPANMTELATYSCGIADGQYKGVKYKEAAVYLLVDSDSQGSFVEVVDVSDLAIPVQTGSVKLVSSARDLCMDPVLPRIYVAVGYIDDATQGFQIVDHSDKTAPTVLATQTIEKAPFCVCYANQTVYIGANEEDANTGARTWLLDSYNVSDVNQISRIAQTGGNGAIYDLLYENNYLFTAVQGGVAELAKSVCFSDFDRQPFMDENSDPGMLLSGSGTVYKGGLFVFDPVSLANLYLLILYSPILLTQISPASIALSFIAYISGSAGLLSLAFYGSYGMGFLGVGYNGSGVEPAQQPVYQPVEYELCQNYPNPFNPETRIDFRLDQKAHVKLTVFDINGRQVRQLVNQVLGIGKQSLVFDANGLPGGIYTYCLEVDGQSQVRKMVLVK